MNASTYLSVNLNKVALVRNSRSLDVPSVMRAAMLCLEAGAHGITVHPRPDARHILTRDLIELATLLQAWPDREFNIEGNPLHNLMDVVGELIARHLPVHQVTFVPDDPGQFTSDHGWCFPQDARRLGPLMDQAHAWGLRVSLFMDAEVQSMAAARAAGADRIELYTEPYAAAWQTPGQAAQLARFSAAARSAHHEGLSVNAGHDLNRDNLTGFVANVPGVSEVSIGHALIADALEWGYAATVKAYLSCIQAGLSRRSQAPCRAVPSKFCCSPKPDEPEPKK